jgi:predicted flap endonuclease-1-like 5' DNA nuclease
VDNPSHISKIASLEASLAAASVAGAAVTVKAAAKPATKKAAPVKAAPVKAAAVKAPAKKPAAKAAPVLNKDLAKSFGFNPRGMDDLEVIEGIGPKIKGLFHADGIKLFSELGATPVKKMQAVLDAAGPRYKLANPSTWAAQAKLAAANKWEQLRKLQDELNAGVKK